MPRLKSALVSLALVTFATGCHDAAGPTDESLALASRFSHLAEEAESASNPVRARLLRGASVALRAGVYPATRAFYFDGEHSSHRVLVIETVSQPDPELGIVDRTVDLIAWNHEDASSFMSVNLGDGSADPVGVAAAAIGAGASALWVGQGQYELLFGALGAGCDVSTYEHTEIGACRHITYTVVLPRLELTPAGAGTLPSNTAAGARVVRMPLARVPGIRLVER